MSKRRQPGEIVVRRPGSGFTGSPEPRLVRVPDKPKYEAEQDYCTLDCGDPDCREWANLTIAGGEFDGQTMHHISECEMEDVS